jgi:hypothetical protein
MSEASAAKSYNISPSNRERLSGGSFNFEKIKE